MRWKPSPSRNVDRRLNRARVTPFLAAVIGTALLGPAMALPASPAPQQQERQKTPAPSQSPQARQRDDSAYDPLPAEQDVEVGTFYMHKGDIDAAIARFQDAVRLRPNLAKARLLLAEAYEKKGDRAAAVKSYKEYLQTFPKSPDAKKIQRKIEKLSREKS